MSWRFLKGQEAGSWEDSSLDGAPDALLKLIPTHILANSKRNKQPRQEPCSRQTGRVGRFEQSVPWNEPPESALSRIRGVDDGVARRVVQRTDCIRNGQVPAVAKLAWETLMETFK